MTSSDMQERGAAYTRFLAHLDARGQAGLHALERETLREAADALLFSEPEADEKSAKAGQVLDNLLSSGRWDAERIELMRRELGACAESALVGA